MLAEKPHRLVARNRYHYYIKFVRLPFLKEALSYQRETEIFCCHRPLKECRQLS